MKMTMVISQYNDQDPECVFSYINIDRVKSVNCLKANIYKLARNKQ